MDKVEFYCLNYNNPERKERMKTRFETLDISCNFYHGVGKYDKRFEKITINLPYSCMYGHLDMIYHFYHHTDKPYGIFCEDDILIHKDFKQYLPKIMDDFQTLNLDVLLLGYLVTYNINQAYTNDMELKTNYEKEDFSYKYYNFANDIWGTQMYMLSRENAKRLLDKYAIGYLEKVIEDSSLTPFSADHTITKDGNRALLYPLLAIEDGTTIYDHYGQKMFHYNSYIINYVAGSHI